MRGWAQEEKGRSAERVPKLGNETGEGVGSRVGEKRSMRACSRITRETQVRARSSHCCKVYEIKVFVNGNV